MGGSPDDANQTSKSDALSNLINFSSCNQLQAHFQSDYLLLKPTRTIIVDLEQVVEGTLARPDGQSVAECLKNDPQCGFGTPQLTKKPEHLQVPNLTRQTPNGK